MSNLPGGHTTWHEGPGRAHPPGGRPQPHGPHMAPLHLFQHPHTPFSSRKHHHLAQTRVLAHLAAIFVLLARSSIHKTALGDFSSVCDSSNGPISFCSSALFIANFCCLGDSVLELACQIYLGGTPPGTRVQGVPTPLGGAPSLMGPTWPPSTYSSTHTLLFPPENITT